MFPILPILILLLLGPTNVERLAVEGRLPAALLAAHRSMVAPIRATVVAPVEEEAPIAAARKRGPTVVGRNARVATLWTAAMAVVLPGCPPRAGPQVG
jgi:hypothetical protein